VAAWNMMAGLDWAALPMVCDLLGVNDPERLVQQLILLRDNASETNG